MLGRGVMASGEGNDLIIGSPIKTIGAKTVDSSGNSVVAGRDAVSADVMQLALADLLPDSDGTVVLFAAEGVQINLSTQSSLLDSGISGTRVTASGIDVTGHRFYQFDDGMTLYSAAEISISKSP